MRETTCGVNEALVIGDSVRVVVLGVHGDEVRLGFGTPGEDTWHEETAVLVQDGPVARVEVPEPVAV